MPAIRRSFCASTVRSYGAERIELSSQFTEIERRARNSASPTCPRRSKPCFAKRSLCYSHGAFNAFASMCRRTMQAAFADLGEAGKLRMFDELNELRDMAQVDAASFTLIKRVIFGTDADPAAGCAAAR